MNQKIILVFLCLLYPLIGFSQMEKNMSRMTGQNPQSKKSAVQDLSRSLQSGRKDEALAARYEAAAQELITKKDYAKAENFLKTAKQLYERRRNKEKIAAVVREIAKVQEAQSKESEAIESYLLASRTSVDETQKSLNNNDASRLRSRADTKSKTSYIQQNIDLMESSEDKAEQATAYQQMAEVNLQMNNKPEAIGNLKNALDAAKGQPEKAVEIKREMANVYASSKEYEKAIDINEKMVAEAREANDPQMEIAHLQNLSSSYFDANAIGKGVSSLKEAYNIALKEGRTIDAKRSLDLLTSYYRKERDLSNAVTLYVDFMDRFESLIKSDSSLIDSKILEENLSKIEQLEKERALKDELIEKTNTFNYVLIGSIFIVLVFLLLIVKALYDIRRKNKKIALQSLRREMNPHFIFNSLNSVNQFIAQNNEMEANKYLSSYSKLMRNMMENSNNDFIPLSTELDQMKEYLDLEHLRFNEKFSYEIEVDDNLDADALYVPNMLIQPQLENAVWHGLRYKETKGLLSLRVYEEKNTIYIKIEDNGIGLKKSKELKTKNQKAHKSRGLNNTQERVELLNKLYNSSIVIDISDKIGEDPGVLVTISFPIINKKIVNTARKTIKI